MLYCIFATTARVKHGRSAKRSGKAIKKILINLGVILDFFSAPFVSRYVVVNDSQMIDHEDKYSIYQLPPRKISKMRFPLSDEKLTDKFAREQNSASFLQSLRCFSQR